MPAPRRFPAGRAWSPRTPASSDWLASLFWSKDASTMRTVPAAVVTLVLALTVSPALARREWVHVDDYNGKILVVQATINQSISGRFILDTGATYCVVSKETAAAANLDGR